MKQNNSEEYTKWVDAVVLAINSYPLIKNKWKMSKIIKLYNDGFSSSEAIRIWYCNHNQ